MYDTIFKEYSIETIELFLLGLMNNQLEQSHGKLFLYYYNCKTFTCAKMHSEMVKMAKLGEIEKLVRDMSITFIFILPLLF